MPISPTFTEDQISDWIVRGYGIKVMAVEELGGFEDQNFRVLSERESQYVLKIHHSETRGPVLDLQKQVMERLSSCISTIIVPKVIPAADNNATCALTAADGTQFLSHLLTFLPGKLLSNIDEPGPELLESLGRMLAATDKALHGFHHPGAHRPNLQWDLQNAPQIRSLLQFVREPNRRRLAEYFLMRFETDILPLLRSLRHSVVHNDAHRDSVLVHSNSSGQNRAAGLIDFGDTCYTATICNLAIAAYDVMLGREDPIAAVLPLVGAYHQEFPLFQEEVDLLYYLAAVRMSIYICMSAKACADDPGNAHARRKEEAVFKTMERLIAINPSAAANTLRDACKLPSTGPLHKLKRESAINARIRHFSESIYTHYETPVYLVGGGLQYLYDDEGHALLDCVNNVCQWGHCHPHIVRAANLQTARLNINSRYVYDGMTAYAERLVATMPAPLSICFFVNSGSEANDLALRLAGAYSQNKDVIVLDKAYHGNSWLCTQISPHRIDREGQSGLPDFVRKVPTPDVYRGLYRTGEENLGGKYAAHVQSVVDEMLAKGCAPSAFIAESLIGTGGQLVLPAGYLQQAYASVRAAGGVCIADEVQVGFGRTGEQTWCFESQDVVPDIVTMGKPIGNGHPMAAVITTPEIAAAFDSRGPYFNTFGGNPVSCAVGMAVLDVLESEGIKANVVDKGGKLREGLLQLQQEHKQIGDVRGLGLYIGVEIVKKKDEPDAIEARRLVEFLKKCNVLVNTNGYDNNVLKIKPPLIISDADVHTILSGLLNALTEIR